MTVKHIGLVISLFLCSVSGFSQNRPPRKNLSEESGEEAQTSSRRIWGRDTTSKKEEKFIPIGLYQWRIDPRLGTIIHAENKDTVVHNFQNFNNTDGYTGQYNYLGNAGSPRLHRVFMAREESDDFLFVRPFSFFRGSLQEFRFSNTLSPITNLAYHKCGNSQNGEDRFRAYFATNIKKNWGMGFQVDYLYGRGYYNSQPNSLFGSSFYGYHTGDKYNAHAFVNVNHFKMGENGGIEDDRYIKDPQSFPQEYTTKDIPVLLSQTWNRNHERTFYFTHRYNLGFYKDIQIPDSLKPIPPSEAELLSQLTDSIQTILKTDSLARRQAVDSLLNQWQAAHPLPQDFVPVSSIIHTLDIRDLLHDYVAHHTPEDYYTNHYYGALNDVYDVTKALSVKNTLGLSLREGFNKWAQMGITLFASHQFRSYRLPMDTIATKTYHENDISVGGEIARTQGKIVNYNINGEMWLVGTKSGDFSVDGKLNTAFKLGKKDTMQIDVRAFIKHTKPDFYYRHYHSQFTWWDHTGLDREIKSRVEGTIHFKRQGTRIGVGLENLKNYTYFAMKNTLKDSTDAVPIPPTAYSHDVGVSQHSKNIQVLYATLGQDLKFGPFHWDSEATYQQSSSQTALPLPKLTLYTNVYFLFRLAKVLRVQVGGDMRYFTSYYAPDYAPSIGQFAVQDVSQQRTKIGNYPIINVYANLHLKRCRLYVKGNHVNAAHGHAFLAPHYPINPLTFHFGVSWNFFN